MTCQAHVPAVGMRAVLLALLILAPSASFAVSFPFVGRVLVDTSVYRDTEPQETYPFKKGAYIYLWGKRVKDGWYLTAHSPGDSRNFAGWIDSRHIRYVKPLFFENSGYPNKQVWQRMLAWAEENLKMASKASAKRTQIQPTQTRAASRPEPKPTATSGSYKDVFQQFFRQRYSQVQFGIAELRRWLEGNRKSVVATFFAYLGTAAFLTVFSSYRTQVVGMLKAAPLFILFALIPFLFIFILGQFGFWYMLHYGGNIAPLGYVDPGFFTQAVIAIAVWLVGVIGVLSWAVFIPGIIIVPLMVLYMLPGTLLLLAKYVFFLPFLLVTSLYQFVHYLFVPHPVEGALAKKRHELAYVQETHVQVLNGFRKRWDVWENLAPWKTRNLRKRVEQATELEKAEERLQNAITENYRAKAGRSTH